MSSLVLRDCDPTKDKSYERAVAARALTDWLDYKEWEGAADRTLDQYERDLARLFLAFPSKQLHEITDGDVAHVLRSFPDGPGRRVREAAFRSFFKWARGTRRIGENPMELLPRQRRRSQKYLETFTAAEQEALCALPGLDGLLCRLLLETGLRKAEARHLQVRHVDLDRGKVIVLSGKGEKDRVVPMWATLRQHVADYLLTDPLRPTDYWWPATFANAVRSRRRHTQPIGDGTFSRWWGSPTGDPPGVIGTAGVRYLKPHTTRHTFATELRRRGIPLEDVQMLLGHSSIATTSDIYVHTTVEDIAARMALIEAGE